MRILPACLSGMCVAAMLSCGDTSTEQAPQVEVVGATPLPAAIAPIVEERCKKCHVEESRGQFSMASLESALKGGKSGVVIVPGDSANSRMYQLVAGLVADKRMPPKGDPLSPEQVAAIQAWIDAGAS